MKKVGVAFCIGGWLLLAVRVAIYSLLSSDHPTFLGIDLTQDVASGRLQGLIWIGAGLLPVIVALFVRRGWQALVAISAILYLAVWYMLGPMSEVGVIDGYRLKWQLASTLHHYEWFVVRDVVLPVAFVSALVIAAIAVFDRRPRTTDSQTR